MTVPFFSILFRPSEFFSRLVTEKENMTWPLVILLAGGIAAAGYGYLIGGVTAQMMGDAIPGIGAIITISSVFGAIIGVFIFWLIWSAVTYALSMIFKGEGTFRRTLEVIAYGYLPQVFGSIIILIAGFEYIPKIVVPKITSAMMQDPAAIQAATKMFVHDPAMMELTQIASLVTIVFLLWSANIWIFGLQHARKLSARDAALCVGIPVIAYILYLIYMLGAA